ncbi:hypothetical protein E0K83_16035 [Gramella sp. BOM4]|nr:hypothetical protein [Christiangramia bathymodioli]
MYKNFYFILILILPIVSCKNENGNSIEKPVAENTELITPSKTKKIEKENSTSKSESFIRVSLVKNWINNIQLQSVEKEEVILLENKYDSKKVDTLQKITSDKNDLELYISGGKKIIKSAIIKNPGSGLGKIKIGMNVEDFEKAINEDLSANSDVIIFSNFEQTNQFEFRLIDQKLTEIRYYGYVD